ncbi:complement regulator-acquiring protein, partial [Borreliella valaisiana]|uniref:complement regulator-acquiring protein n=1 Tax=Borreliella valaisiana TaxID=62088 RepID=UPI001AEFB3AC
KNEQAKISINAKSNTTKDKTNIKAAGLKKNTQPTKNNNLQGLNQANQANQVANSANPASQASPVASPASQVA